MALLRAFFNTYSREIEEFEPRDPTARPIRMYTCGPTVYSRAHIGNFRAYIFEDLLQRHLELRGYKVHRVMNITDVEDKTIRGAREAGIPLQKFTEQFKEAFFEDAHTLRIKRRQDDPPQASVPLQNSQNNSKTLSSKTPTRCVSSARTSTRPRPTNVTSTE